MKTIEEFCSEHRACKKGHEWALAHCETMADVWATAKPEWLIWVATRTGVLTDRELRLLAVFCALQVEHLLTDQRSRDAIAVAEKFANGEATREELAAARAAARAAAWAADAAWATARDAAAGAAAGAAAAWATARAAAWAADAAAIAAAGAAAAAALDAAAAAAATAAEDEDALIREAQADWLRRNTTPNFGG
jgi:hypothetical protein